MNRYVVYKLVISLLLVGSYFILPKYGFTFNNGCAQGGFDALAPHLFYPLSHANIWHLLANCLCLFLLRCPLYIFITYSIAVVCSFLPSFSIYDIVTVPFVSTGTEPTYGFSGVLFAMVGISWGKIHRFKDMMVRNKWILIIPAFIPHINFLIHIYCLLLGYLYGSVCCHSVATKKS